MVSNGELFCECCGKDITFDKCIIISATRYNNFNGIDTENHFYCETCFNNKKSIKDYT